MYNKDTFRNNNFNLLRLIAASQVVVGHIIEIMQVHPSGVISSFLRLLHLFPGVPIFFFISGFLISKSFENNHRLIEYIQNRVLRLYPALIACVSLSFVLIAVSGYMAETNAGTGEWIKLYLAKISFLQFYNPDFMRSYGDGVLNGSLWTITVELQFYILVPIIYYMFRLYNGQSKINYKLLFLILVFFLANRIFSYTPGTFHDEIWFKLIRVSFIPWFYMFLIGVFFQKNFSIFHRLLADRFILVIVLYMASGYLIFKSNVPLGNNINPIVFLLLTLVIFSFAYSYPYMSRKFLKGNDISYGTYIYHMPIINFLLYLGFKHNIIAAIAAFSLTYLVAIASWKLIERRSLALKRHPLNPINMISKE